MLSILRLVDALEVQMVPYADISDNVIKKRLEISAQTNNAGLEDVPADSIIYSTAVGGKTNSIYFKIANLGDRSADQNDNVKPRIKISGTVQNDCISSPVPLNFIIKNINGLDEAEELAGEVGADGNIIIKLPAKDYTNVSLEFYLSYINYVYEVSHGINNTLKLRSDIYSINPFQTDAIAIANTTKVIFAAIRNNFIAEILNFLNTINTEVKIITDKSLCEIKAYLNRKRWHTKKTHFKYYHASAYDHVFPILKQYLKVVSLNDYKLLCDTYNKICNKVKPCDNYQAIFCLKAAFGICIQKYPEFSYSLNNENIHLICPGLIYGDYAAISKECITAAANFSGICFDTSAIIGECFDTKDLSELDVCDTKDDSEVDSEHMSISDSKVDEHSEDESEEKHKRKHNKKPESSWISRNKLLVGGATVAAAITISVIVYVFVL